MKKFLVVPIALLFLYLPLHAGTVGGFTAPDGTECNCPLPEEFHIKNRGGSDGSGLCVFASITHSAIWQDVDPIRELFQWMWKHPGGGYPEKVDVMIKRLCQEKGMPVPRYLQVEKTDLKLLQLACKSGRIPGITYNHSPTGRYGGQRIAHMVSLVHASENLYGILDNNYPKAIEWLNEKEFLSVDPSWSVYLLDPGPPMPPKAPFVPPQLSGLNDPMNRINSFLVALPLFLSPPTANAGWGSGGCAPSSGGFQSSPQFVRPVSTPVASGYRWAPVNNPPTPDQLALLKDNVQVGIWRYEDGKYFSVQAGDQWLECPCPFTAPLDAESRKVKLLPGCTMIGDEINFGVDKSKVNYKDGSVYSINGVPCSKKQAYEAVGDTLVDDSSFYRLTVVGTEAVRKQVMADLDSIPYLKQWKSKLVVKSYAADHWAVKGLGFLPEGKAFSLLVQLPNGEPLHRQYDYDDGSAGLSEALRKVDPLYKPEKDKDQRKVPDELSIDGIVEQIKNLPTLAWVGLAALAFLWWTNRNKSQAPPAPPAS